MSQKIEPVLPQKLHTHSSKKSNQIADAEYKPTPDSCLMPRADKTVNGTNPAVLI